MIKNGRAGVNQRREGPEDADLASRNGALFTGQVDNGEPSSIPSALDIEPMPSAVDTATDVVEELKMGLRWWRHVLIRSQAKRCLDDR